MKLKREHRIKRTILNTFEALLNSKQKNLYDSNTTDKSSSSSSTTSSSTFLSISRFFMEKIIKSMLSNFEIQIKNFHFRYEDQISCDSEFCFGMTMESFTFQSSPSTTSSSTSSTFGMISSLLSSSSTQPISLNCTIDSVSIYLNQLFSHNNNTLALTNLGSLTFTEKSSDEIMSLMFKTIPRHNETLNTTTGELFFKPKHQYLIKPFHTICQVDISFGINDQNGNNVSNEIQVIFMMIICTLLYSNTYSRLKLMLQQQISQLI